MVYLKTKEEQKEAVDFLRQLHIYPFKGRNDRILFNDIKETGLFPKMDMSKEIGIAEYIDRINQTIDLVVDKIKSPITGEIGIINLMNYYRNDFDYPVLYVSFAVDYSELLGSYPITEMLTIKIDLNVIKRFPRIINAMSHLDMFGSDHLHQFIEDTACAVMSKWENDLGVDILERMNRLFSEDEHEYPVNSVGVKKVGTNLVIGKVEVPYYKFIYPFLPRSRYKSIYDKLAYEVRCDITDMSALSYLCLSIAPLCGYKDEFDLLTEKISIQVCVLDDMKSDGFMYIQYKSRNTNFIPFWIVLNKKVVFYDLEIVEIDSTILHRTFNAILESIPGIKDGTDPYKRLLLKRILRGYQYENICNAVNDQTKYLNLIRDLYKKSECDPVTGDLIPLEPADIIRWHPIFTKRPVTDFSSDQLNAFEPIVFKFKNPPKTLEELRNILTSMMDSSIKTQVFDYIRDIVNKDDSDSLDSDEDEEVDDGDENEDDTGDIKIPGINAMVDWAEQLRLNAETLAKMLKIPQELIDANYKKSEDTDESESAFSTLKCETPPEFIDAYDDETVKPSENINQEEVGNKDTFYTKEYTLTSKDISILHSAEGKQGTIIVLHHPDFPSKNTRLLNWDDILMSHYIDLILQREDSIKFIFELEDVAIVARVDPYKGLVHSIIKPEILSITITGNDGNCMKITYDHEEPVYAKELCKMLENYFVDVKVRC